MPPADAADAARAELAPPRIGYLYAATVKTHTAVLSAGRVESLINAISAECFNNPIIHRANAD